MAVSGGVCWFRGGNVGAVVGGWSIGLERTLSDAVIQWNGDFATLAANVLIVLWCNYLYMPGRHGSSEIVCLH